MPSSALPGSAVSRLTPAATRSGLTKPSKARPRDENGATRPSTLLASPLSIPIDTSGRRPKAKCVEHGPPGPARDGDDGNRHSFVEADPASRQRVAVDDDEPRAGLDSL